MHPSYSRMYPGCNRMHPGCNRVYPSYTRTYPGCNLTHPDCNRMYLVREVRLAHAVVSPHREQNGILVGAGRAVGDVACPRSVLHACMHMHMHTHMPMPMPRDVPRDMLAHGVCCACARHSI